MWQVSLNSQIQLAMFSKKVIHNENISFVFTIIWFYSYINELYKCHRSHVHQTTCTGSEYHKEVLASSNQNTILTGPIKTWNKTALYHHRLVTTFHNIFHKVFHSNKDMDGYFWLYERFFLSYNASDFSGHTTHTFSRQIVWPFLTISHNFEWSTRNVCSISCPYFTSQFLALWIFFPPLKAPEG